MPWYAIGLIALIGFFSLLCGLTCWIMDRDGSGEKRVIFGGGLLGAALILAIGKSIYEGGKLAGWWS